MQWNLPMLNLERAWDIQPQAGSAITVAVLDSGMAYRNDDVQREHEGLPGRVREDLSAPWAR